MTKRHDPRSIDPSAVHVYCPDGRWGPRRTRVSECFATLCVEDLYTELVAIGADVRPGWEGTVRVRSADRLFLVDVVATANAVWRVGRLFLLCVRCCGRCTRLYLP